jgi:hypothetical protein
MLDVKTTVIVGDWVYHSAAITYREAHYLLTIFPAIPEAFFPQKAAEMCVV